MKIDIGTGSFSRVRLVKYEKEYFAMKMMRNETRKSYQIRIKYYIKIIITSIYCEISGQMVLGFMVHK